VQTAFYRPDNKSAVKPPDLGLSVSLSLIIGTCRAVKAVRTERFARRKNISYTLPKTSDLALRY
jgi:hypothetical protein